MCYFSNALKYPAEAIAAIVHALNDPKFDRVDFLVGTGVSGTLLLIPVSLQTNLPCGVIRKTIDAENSKADGGSHSDQAIEMCYKYKPYRYVIIDDLIDSGQTVKQIISVMASEYKHIQCVGIILYHNFLGMDNPSWHNIPMTCLLDDIRELRRMIQ